MANDHFGLNAFGSIVISFGLFVIYSRPLLTLMRACIAFGQSDISSDVLRLLLGLFYGQRSFPLNKLTYIRLGVLSLFWAMWVFSASVNFKAVLHLGSLAFLWACCDFFWAHLRCDISFFMVLVYVFLNSI